MILYLSRIYFNVICIVNNNLEYFHLNKCVPLFYEESIANEFIKEIEKHLHNENIKPLNITIFKVKNFILADLDIVVYTTVDRRSANNIKYLNDRPVKHCILKIDEVSSKVDQLLKEE